MKSAATTPRSLSTFLLVTQLEAKAIGARIQQARLEAGMTQEQVAEVATFSKRSLQDYEAGVTIPYRHLREIARLLDRPVEWLLHGPAAEEGAGPESFARHLDDIEGKLDRLTAIVERIAEGRAGARDDPDDHRSVANG